MDSPSLLTANDTLKETGLEPDDIHEAVPDETIRHDKNETIGSDGNTGSAIYFPVMDTLRLYAGWLLAGYISAYFLGAYQFLKPIPFEIPYVAAFLQSPIILRFSLACFLFLLVTGITKAIKGKTALKILIVLSAIALLTAVHINVP